MPKKQNSLLVGGGGGNKTYFIYLQGNKTYFILQLYVANCRAIKTWKHAKTTLFMWQSTKVSLVLDNIYLNLYDSAFVEV